MPRNRSEKVPHRHLSDLYHERARCWAAYEASSTELNDIRWGEAYDNWIYSTQAVSDRKAAGRDDFKNLCEFYRDQALSEQKSI